MTVTQRVFAASDRLPAKRLMQLVSAASYGCVLVLAALSVIGVSEVASGHSSELVAGVGVATWIAHLFAELLAAHLELHEPLHRSEVKRAAVDGSPILIVPILPALALGLGRLDVISDESARIAAILITVLQLFVIGAFVGRAAPSRKPGWGFGLATAGMGLVVVMLKVFLGH